MPGQGLSEKRWRDLSDAELTTVLVTGLIVAGVVLRVQGIGAPAFFTFDEEPFAVNAHRYLLHTADNNDHPPLGKLLQAVGYLLFDYTTVGWRFVALCFGIQSILIAYWLGNVLFERRRAGLFAAACVAADGFFVSYSRAGLLDGMLVCFVLWSFLAAVAARSVRGVAVSALLVGLAASIKWSGVMAVVPAMAAVYWLGRAPRSALALFALVPIVHVAVWMAGLRISAQPSGLADVSALMVKLYHHHQGRGVEQSDLASPWYTWPLLLQPIVIKTSLSGIHGRHASSVGNLLLWAAGSLSVIAVPLVAGLCSFKNRWRRYLEFIDRTQLQRGLLLCLGWLALLVPWMVGRGQFTFIYHYLPAYGFALVLVGASLAEIERKHPKLVLGFFTLATLVAVYYAPVWAELPLSNAAMTRRLPFYPWQP